jgi:hypothetical protein
MAINAVDVTQSLLSYTVVNDKGSLVALLERNGIKMPNNPSDSEVTASVLLASSKSANFKSELAKLLTKKAEEAGTEFKSFVGQMMGFTGIDDYSFTGIEGFANAPGDLPRASAGLPNVKPKPVTLPANISAPSGVVTAPKKGKTKAGTVLGSIGKWLGENVLTKDNINAGVQIGLTSINNKVQGKSNALQSETNTLTQMQDDIRASQGKAAGGSKLSTMAWVGIGVGVIAVVGLVIYLSKKK